ncbi:hypothetical protein [Streptohalobacillus salinus]|nr:hypothetical protein [Streptohalobacillus salinus]
MRKGLFVVFLLLIVGFFVIGYQIEQNDSQQSNLNSDRSVTHTEVSM